MRKEKMRLGDLGTGHVWFTSAGQPAGCDLIAEPDDQLDLPDAWWNLRGYVTDNKWEWDGAGRPTDFKANTVNRIVAFVKD
jgi:hypothetical protein